ncbi:MAG: hydroxylysine kinase [Gammaproteobacteria bacterium]|jgi:hydroxylysine kinase
MNIDSITAQDMRFNPPTFDETEVAQRIAAQYGFEGQWSSLNGERDQNYRLKAHDGKQYVVKISGPDEKPDITNFQVEALLYLENGSPQIPLPRIIRTKSGECLSDIIDTKSVKHAIRVVSYLDGIPYGDGDFPDAENLQKIGAFMGKMVIALKGFEHKASKHFTPWNLSNGIAVSHDLWIEANEDIKSLAAPMLDRLRDEVLPALNNCSSQVIHNDGHPYNLLRANAISQEVVGLIDFGDMVYAPIINELAVTATTFQRRDKEDLSIVENLLIGFHRTHPLSNTEVSLLWDAIILRLLITVLLSDMKVGIGTDQYPDAFADRSEAYEMLVLISQVQHNSIVNKLRAACGFY